MGQLTIRNTCCALVLVTALLVPGSPIYGQHSTAGQNSGSQTQSPEMGFVFRNFAVNCDQPGQSPFRSIAKALRYATPGAHIKIRGTCSEQIVIDQDDITLVGIDGAVIDGGGPDATITHEGTVTIDGGHNVTLKDLTIINGPDTGLLARNGAQVVLDGITSTGHATAGIVFDNSAGKLSDVIASDNGGVGIDSFTNSSLIFTGPVSTNNNGGPGLEANGNSFIELRGAIATSSNNGGDGVLLVGDSVMQIFSFPEAQGSGVIADNNAGNGMLLATSELVVVGSQFADSGANEFILTNNTNGIFMPTGAINNPFGTARFDIRGNSVGILAVDGAQIFSQGGMNISANGAGLVGDAAGTFTIISTPPNPSVIQGNFQDVSLSFGTRVTFSGVAIDSIDCDTTVLSRGSVVCP